MKSCLRKQRAIIATIGAGVATRGFHILCDREQIEVLEGGNKTQLKRLQKLAREHGWRVTVHERNGWLRFTKDSHFPAPQVAGNSDHLADFAELFKNLRSLEPRLRPQGSPWIPAGGNREIEHS